MNVLRYIQPPDLFTILNISLGFLSILLIRESQSYEMVAAAVGLIILAAGADGLDGFVARKMGSGPLGANLDSLADLVSFGVAPAFIAVQAFALLPGHGLAAIFFPASAEPSGWPDSTSQARMISSSKASPFQPQAWLYPPACF